MNSTTTSAAASTDRHPGLLNWAAILAFFASYFAARFLVRDVSIGVPLRAALCVLPAGLGALALWRVVQYARALSDELERRVQLEAFAFAFPAGLLVSMALGFLEHSRLLHVDPWDYWFFHLPMYFLGLVLAKRRYQ